MPEIGYVPLRAKGAWTSNNCNTGYSLWSDDGGHNCHDDSRLQMANLVFGHDRQQDPGWQYWCEGTDDDTDISVDILFVELDQSGYPNTTNNQNRGYEHPDMCRRRNTHGYNSAAACYCDAACTSYGDCCVDGPW
jgi:hypothetical protein